jgi:hypothetical protein
MGVSGKKRVNVVAWFTAAEMKDLRRVCRLRDCEPEELLRELALCEIAQQRLDSHDGRSMLMILSGHNPTRHR